MYRRLFRKTSRYTIGVYKIVYVGETNDFEQTWGFTGDISQLSDEELMSLYDEYVDSPNQPDSPYACIICENGKFIGSSSLINEYNISNAIKFGSFLTDVIIGLRDASSYWNKKMPNIEGFLMRGTIAQYGFYRYINAVQKLQYEYPINIEDFWNRIMPFGGQA